MDNPKWFSYLNVILTCFLSKQAPRGALRRQRSSRTTATSWPRSSFPLWRSCARTTSSTAPCHCITRQLESWGWELLSDLVCWFTCVMHGPICWSFMFICCAIGVVNIMQLMMPKCTFLISRLCAGYSQEVLCVCLFAGLPEVQSHRHAVHWRAMQVAYYVLMDLLCLDVRPECTMFFIQFLCDIL